MNTVKNAIAASALILANIFSPSASAEITGDQIEPMTDTFLAQAAVKSNPMIRECINDKFIGKSNGQKTESWSLLHQAMIIAVAKNLVDDDVTFSIIADDFIKQACGDNP